MSLKSIGELSGFVNNLNNLAKGSSEWKDSFKNIRNALDGLTVDEALEKLQKLKINPEFYEGLLKSAQRANILKGSADEIAKKVADVGKSSSFIDDLGLAFKGLGTEVLSVLKMLATNPLTWAITGGLVLAGIIDYFTVSYDEANKALDEANKKYKETQNNIESLNDEYETNEAKIKELQKLQGEGTITDLQKEELKNLEDKNAQLETQIALQKELLKLQNQDKSEAAKDLANAESHSVAQSVKMGDETGKNTFKQTVGSVTDAEAIKEDLALIDEYKFKVSSLENDLINAQMDVSNAKSPFAKWTAELKVSNIKNDIDNYKTSLETLYEDLETRSSNAQKTLENLKLDPETNATEIEVYEEALKSMETQLLEVKAAMDSVNETPIFDESQLPKSFSKEEMISQLTEMSDGFESLQKIYDNISSSDPFDFTLLNDKDFKDTFSGLGDAYTNFVEQVTNTPNDIKSCQSAFDLLVTEWIKKLGILNGITKENANVTISMLEQMGVANAKEIVNQMFEIVNQESEILNQAEEEFLTTYQKYLTSKDEADLEYLKSSASKNGQLLSALGETYKKDYENWCELLEKKAEAYNELVAAVGGSYNSSVSVVENLLANGEAITMSSIIAGETAKGAYEAAAYAAKQYANTIKLDLSGIKTDFGTAYKPNIGGSSSSSSKETKETFDWIERAIQKVQRTITNLGKTVSATYKTWTTRNNALVKQISAINEEITLQEKAAEYYKKRASEVGLSSTYQELVNNGAIKVEDITDKKLAEKIKAYQDFIDKANAAADAADDLRDELSNLARQKFDNVINDYENQISLIEHDISLLEAQIDRVETRGHLVSTKYYSSLAESQEEYIKLLEDEYNSLNTSLEEAMSSGKIEKYSEEWYNMVSDINGVKEALVEANTTLIEFNNSIRELEWEKFDRLQETISEITDEAEFLIGLMEDSDLYDDKGQLTDTGMATLGLRSQSYNVLMNQANQYANEIEKINAELANDPNNQELLDRKQELIELQRESILAANDEKNAIRDMVQEGIDLELEALQERIDKIKETKEEMQTLYEYQKKVSEQTKNIASLEKQLSVYEGDDSEENQARIQQIKLNLEEARKTLEETEAEYALSETQKMLDSLQDEYQSLLNSRLDNIDALFGDMIETANANASAINDTLIAESEKVGYTMSQSLQDIWSNEGGAASILTKYGEGFTSQLTAVNNVLNAIARKMDAIEAESDKEAEETIKQETSKVEDINPIEPKPSTPSTNNTPTDSKKEESKKEIKIGGMIDAGSAKIYDYAGDTSPENQYYKSDPKYKVLAIKDNYVQVRHHSLSSGVTGWFKKSDVKAYKSGGLVDETGLAWLDGTKRKPEMVLDAQDTENLIQLKDTLNNVDASKLKPLTEEQIKQFTETLDKWKPFMDSMAGKWADFASSNLAGDMYNEFHMSFDVHGINDTREFINFLISDSTFENAIKAMTVDRLVGGSKFAKNKYITR